MKPLVAPIALVIALVVAVPAQAQDPQPDLGTEAQQEAGRQVYAEKCAQCHGAEGAGDGPATPFLRPAPRNFTSGIFKFRTTTSGELPTTEDLRRSIRVGMPYTSMPAWKGLLSETEIANLAYFIKTFNDDFSGPYGVPQTVEIPKDPGFKTDNIARGREVFMENQCFDCHGDLGRGNGGSAPTLEDQWNAPIPPADLTKRWTFRNGQTRSDIYRTFTTGLDGSPMPSYDMPTEDRWALVDYVWSLSRSDPEYATMVVARGVEGSLDLSQGATLFEEARAAYFPIVGQIIEPGRAFAPGVNGIEVRAVYNQDAVAFLLSWHDMSAQTTGSNSPSLAVPTDSFALAIDTSGTYADAVALQFPSTLAPGIEKPYFLFGDAKRSVDLWFGDLARPSTPRFFVGRGADDVQPGDEDLEMTASYDDGVWTVLFKRARLRDDGLSFAEATFVPVSFSVWDGFNAERGNRRGLTSWTYVYLEPLQTQSAAIPMAKWGLLALLAELLIVGLVRWRTKRKPVEA